MKQREVVVMKRVSVVVAVLMAVFGMYVGAISSATALDNGLALVPPMGWNGYNYYARAVTASIVEAQAQALVSSGMQAAGYEYVNLDGGWDMLARDAQGQLQANPTKFPDGIAPVADYVHSLGLKFGIYTTVGTTNCANTSAGSWGHYQQDAQTFASWGVDFVKVDWCAVPMDQYPGMTKQQVAQQLYGQFGQALQNAGRPMVYSVSTNRADLAAWSWAPDVGNMWRTGGDNTNSYAGMVANFARNVQHYRVAGPDRWNDPDMLEVGNGTMTATEDRAEIGLWSEMAAPLIAGTDLTTMSAAIHDDLTNPAVIAIDQDSLGRQGHPVASAGGHWVLTKPLASGARAVVLFNQTDQPAVITTTARQVGLPSAPKYRVTHVWSHTTTTTTGKITAKVRPHGAGMLQVTLAPK